MAIEASPDGEPPSAAAGSVALTGTLKLVAVVCAGKEPIVLVGGAVSISHITDIVPVPRLPYWSWESAALTEKVYWPSSVVRLESPPIA